MKKIYGAFFLLLALLAPAALGQATSTTIMMYNVRHGFAKRLRDGYVRNGERRCAG